MSATPEIPGCHHPWGRAIFGLSLAVLVVFCLWLVRQGIGVNSQQAAIASVEVLGGSVKYDFHKVTADRPNSFDYNAVPQWPSFLSRVIRFMKPTASTAVPSWLRRSLGDDCFADVVLVILRDTKVSDDDLGVLKSFPKLESLDLSNTQITSRGMAHLEGLTNLQQLLLWETEIGDTGLKHLEGLAKLWLLVLDDTEVTDAGLKHLSGLTNLEEYLGLRRTQVTDAGLGHLQGLTKLRKLNLLRTRVTVSGAKDLERSLPMAEIWHNR